MSLVVGSELRPISTNFRFNSFCGHWPRLIDNRWLKLLHVIYRVCMWVQRATFILLLTVDLVVIWGDVENMNYNLCTTVTNYLGFIKTNIMQFRVQKAEDLKRDIENNFYLDHLGKDLDDRAILRKYSKQARFITKLIMTLAFATVSIWLLIPLIDKKKSGRLPYRMWIPEGNTWYIAAYLWQAYFSPYLVTEILSTDIMFFAFVVQLSGQYTLLENNVRKVGESLGKKVPEGQQATMKDNIRHHQAIIRAVNRVEELYHLLVIIHLASCSLLLAFIGFDMILGSGEFTTQQFTQISYVACAMVDVFVYCLFGSVLEYKSYSLAKAIYDTPWEGMDKATRKDLTIMMLRAQHPPMVTAGKIFYVRLKTFFQILRLAYNMLMLLSEVNKS